MSGKGVEIEIEGVEPRWKMKLGWGFAGRTSKALRIESVMLKMELKMKLKTDLNMKQVSKVNLEQLLQFFPRN